jgi:hypothetical protein
MWLFHRRGKEVPPYHEQMKKADEDLRTSEIQKIVAKEELEEAQSLQRELATIRKDNHFARDFKKALGAKNGF